MLARLARPLCGTRADALLGDAETAADLGAALGGGLAEREVAFLKAHEWAQSPEDVLWRRTKAGLHTTAAEREQATARLEALLRVECRA